jgi:hypothetical protein
MGKRAVAPRTPVGLVSAMTAGGAPAAGAEEFHAPKVLGLDPDLFVATSCLAALATGIGLARSASSLAEPRAPGRR